MWTDQLAYLFLGLAGAAHSPLLIRSRQHGGLADRSNGDTSRRRLIS
jgi:hypothetical protein